jgi:hypothetical protein
MIPLNKLYEYPTSTRALYNGERMYDVGKDKLTIGHHHTSSDTVTRKASIVSSVACTSRHG